MEVSTQVFTHSPALVSVVPGMGESILIGKDCILGMGDATILSGDLISSLNLKGVHYLYQANFEPRPRMICSNWITSDELDLEGQLASKWKNFRCALINTGVQLLMRPEKLKWMGGDSSGLISVKNVYEATEKKKQNFVIGGWRKSLWYWDCSLKLNLFTWLVAENKILTWENLQHRGFNGPSYCILCKKSKETMHHLFVECSFSHAVWERVNFHKTFGGVGWKFYNIML
jgi:hypothetical protein